MDNLPDGCTPHDIDDAAAGRYGDMQEPELVDIPVVDYPDQWWLNPSYRIIKPSDEPEVCKAAREALEAFQRYVEQLRLQPELDAIREARELLEAFQLHAGRCLLPKGK